MSAGRWPRFEDEFAAMRRDAYRTAFGVLGDAQLADDAASEALTQAWLHWSQVGVLDYRTAWVRRVALNAAFRILRKRRPRDRWAAQFDIQFEEEISLRLTLAQAMLSLPRRQRQVVGLHYLADLAADDIAEALGVSANSVKKHLQRGLASLRARVDGEEVAAHASTAAS